MKNIIVHADDFAISENAAKTVAQLIKAGAVQSVSIMPNLSTTRTGIELLKPYKDQVMVCVHLNLVEGKCMAGPEQIPLLADKNGLLKLSWFQIMRKSTSPEFQRQTALEFRTQILNTRALLKEAGFTGRLRLDSHQHTHMIPGIFKVVCGLAGELDAEYIRLTREPISPYIKAWRLWKTYNAVDIVKNLLLNLFSLSDRRMLKRLGLEYYYFFGLLITGKMDYGRVVRNLSRMPGERPVELVLHTGRMLETEITPEYNKKAFIKEHISNWRLLETETAERLKQAEIVKKSEKPLLVTDGSF